VSIRRDDNAIPELLQKKKEREKHRLPEEQVNINTTKKRSETVHLYQEGKDTVLSENSFTRVVNRVTESPAVRGLTLVLVSKKKKIYWFTPQVPKLVLWFRVKNSSTKILLASALKKRVPPDSLLSFPIEIFTRRGDYNYPEKDQTPACPQEKPATHLQRTEKPTRVLIGG